MLATLRALHSDLGTALAVLERLAAAGLLEDVPPPDPALAFQPPRGAEPAIGPGSQGEAAGASPAAESSPVPPEPASSPGEPLSAPGEANGAAPVMITCQRPGCSAVVPRSRPGGTPQRYCSAGCRMAAANERKRQVKVQQATAEPEPPAAVPDLARAERPLNAAARDTAESDRAALAPPPLPWEASP